jgi:hypothetical protein
MTFRDFLEQIALKMHEIRDRRSWMRDNAARCQLRPKKGLTFPSIDIGLQWIPHEFDIAAMLANSSLSCLVFALPKLCRKKKLGEQKLERAQKHHRLPSAKGGCWFMFRECRLCNRLPCQISERNSQTLAPNMSEAVYSSGIVM